MCGIFGVSVRRTEVDSKMVVRDLEALFLASGARGQDAAGLMFQSPTETVVLKAGMSARNLAKTPEFSEFRQKISHSRAQVIMGHTRLATNGSPHIPENNQPCVCSDLIGIHNGIIINDQELWQKCRGIGPKPESDSVTLFELVNQRYAKSRDLRAAIQEIYPLIEGSATLAFLSRITGELLVVTNTQSLYLAQDVRQNIWFASQADFLGRMNNGVWRRGITRVPVNRVFRICRPDQKMGRSIKPRRLSVQIVPTPAPATGLNPLSKLRQHVIDFRPIQKMRRCTRCILPETTPFITFNDQGVCNYCREYQSIEYKGEDALEKILSRHRRTDGRPDCIVAFSGGRDSAYGLHLLKTKYAMHPVAFTYDWGMISDIGRRNQARLVGKLGVEHVVVAADLVQKRSHIRQNIEAWMHRPRLGMIPLFMQGDKHCEYHVDQLKKKYGIDLVIFCRGNALEKEEFKAGHAGVRHADPGGVIHHLPWLEKIQLALYYGKEYVLNPRYLNSSFAQTIAAYIVTYLIPHDYLYLWHYVPWNEKEIVDTLRKEYNWEVSPESTATWRIDDASPAFYNYIYLKTQGFTENDSFRSNQIREGILTRAKALRLIRYENEPRYGAIQWYFDKLKINGDKVLDTIDRLPPLYPQ